MSYTFKTSREIAAWVSGVFAAISAPERLARWWGPAGFTNTFHVRAFRSNVYYKCSKIRHFQANLRSF